MPFIDVKMSRLAGLGVLMIMMGSGLYFQSRPRPDVLWSPSLCRTMTFNFSYYEYVFTEAAQVVSLVWPILPIYSTLKTCQWDASRESGLFSHALGQSTVFGLGEVLRYYLIQPSPFFLLRCNMTLEDCQRVGHLTEPATSFCPFSQRTPEELQRQLHQNPDLASAMLGAAVTSYAMACHLWIAGTEKPSRTQTVYHLLLLVALLLLLYLHLLSMAVAFRYTLPSLAGGLVVQLAAAWLAYCGFL